MPNKKAPLLPLALYVHWPYCLSKCPYCDFNSHVTDHVDHDKWRKAFEADLKAHKTHLGERYITSIFFGGGTPSLMQPETVAHIIDTIKSLWTCANDIEITLEANPTSIEAGKFKAFADAGVNRVSVGVQALNDSDLKALGREHSTNEALKALDIASAHFDRFSFDLIYTREHQTLEDWKTELQQAVPLAKAGHVSLYQLTIESGTQFKTLFDSGRLILPNEDESATFYETTLEMMDKAGLPAYEISNYAQKGQESRHNLTYWKYGDYAGIGPGAHGRLRLFQTDATKQAQSQLTLQQNQSQTQTLFTDTIPRPQQQQQQQQEQPDFVQKSIQNDGQNYAQNVTATPSADLSPQSQFTTISTRGHKAPDIWLDHVLREKHHEAPFQNAKTIGQRSQFEEMMLVGLRLREGLDVENVRLRTGIEVQSQINAKNLEMLLQENLIDQTETNLKLTDKGLPLLDAITSALMA